LNIQTDRALMPAGTATLRYLTISITAPARARRTERPAVRVGLVLDRSGSMAGRKIEMARKAVGHAVQLLNARDHLAVVCYDNEVDTLLGATPASAEAKSLATKRLAAIDARGATDLCAGWLRGAEELTRDGRVLLLSDGLTNQGELDHDRLAQHARDLRARGITTSTFGLGADFDETLMARLATEGGGHFYFVEQPAQIPDFFASELGETLDVVARDARLVIGGGPGIHVGCLNDFPIDRGATGEVQIRLGDLVSEQQLTVVVAIRATAGEAGTDVVITARLTDRDQALFPKSMPIDWSVLEAADDAAQPVNIEVLIAVATLIAHRARAAALEANRRGDFALAERVVQAAAAEVRALAPGTPRPEAIAAELEAETDIFIAPLSALDHKSRHFAQHLASHSREATGKARRRTQVAS
jgi:Ca-activated chloride channel family protein